VMSHPEGKAWSAAAGCLDSLLRHKPADELIALQQDRFIQAEHHCSGRSRKRWQLGWALNKLIV
jgi:hypothetical protein